MVGVGSLTWRTNIKTEGVEYNVPVGKKAFDFFGSHNLTNGMNRVVRKLDIIDDAVANRGMNADVDAKLVVKKQSSTIRMKNESNATVYVTLYVVRCKKDIPVASNVDTMLKHGFENIGLADSHDQGQGVTLADNSKFNQYFTIVSKGKYTLLAGGEKSKTIWDNTPKKWSKNQFILDDSAADLNMYSETRGGLLFGVVMHGQLSFDETTTQNIGYAPITVDFFFENSTTYTVATGNTREVVRADITTIPVTPFTRINQNIDKIAVD